MSKITRYDGDFPAFGEDFQSQERTAFGTEDVGQNDLTQNMNQSWLRGWGVISPSEFPPIQYFNALGFTLSRVLEYLHQMGVAEWHVEQEYHTGSFTQKGGSYWASKVDDNVGNDPETDDGTNWVKVPNAEEVESQINNLGVAQSVDSVSTLRTSSFPANLERLYLSGYNGEGTPGGDELYADRADTTTADNNVTVFVDADGVRWKRPLTGTLSVDKAGGNIQDAIDVVPSNGTHPTESIYLPTDNGTNYGQKASIPASPESWKMHGIGWGTYWTYSGTDHVLTVNAKDTTLKDFWVDHLGSGPYDGIRGEAPDLILRNMAVDNAPRHCVYLNGNKNWISGFKSSNPGGSAQTGIYINNGARTTHMSVVQLFAQVIGIDCLAENCGASGLYLNAQTTAGLRLQSLAKYGNWNLEARSCNVAVECDGDWNTVTASIQGRNNSDVKGINVTGSENEFFGVIRSTSDNSDGFVSSGSGNSFTGTISLSSATNGKCVDLQTGSDDSTLHVKAICQSNSNAVQIDSNYNTGVIKVNGGSKALAITGNQNDFRVNLRDAAGDQFNISGDRNTLTGTVTGDGTIDGSQNIIYGRITGNLVINGDDNDVSNAVIEGSITDNGLNNVT